MPRCLWKMRTRLSFTVCVSVAVHECKQQQTTVLSNLPSRMGLWGKSCQQRSQQQCFVDPCLSLLGQIRLEMGILHSLPETLQKHHSLFFIIIETCNAKFIIHHRQDVLKTEKRNYFLLRGCQPSHFRGATPPCDFIKLMRNREGPSPFSRFNSSAAACASSPSCI